MAITWLRINLTPPNKRKREKYNLAETPTEGSSISLLGHVFISDFKMTSMVAQIVKHLPAMWEAWVRSLDREDPLEKGMATHSSILAWRIPSTEEPGGLQFMGSQRVGYIFL